MNAFGLHCDGLAVYCNQQQFNNDLYISIDTAN